MVARSQDVRAIVGRGPNKIGAFSDTCTWSRRGVYGGSRSSGMLQRGYLQHHFWTPMEVMVRTDQHLLTIRSSDFSTTQVCVVERSLVVALDRS